jgi:hypothetical protein
MLVVAARSAWREIVRRSNAVAAAASSIQLERLPSWHTPPGAVLTLSII